MEKSEITLDLASRKLDFDAIRGGSEDLKLSPPTPTQAVPQSLSHSILRPPLSQSQHLRFPTQLQLYLQSQRPPSCSQPQRQQQRTLHSQVMPQLKAPRPQPVLPVHRLPQPAQKHPVKMLQLVKQEFPRSQPQNNVELKHSTPKKQKHCNCKNSRCLKLYCECFAAGIYCDGCNCLNCHNNADNEAARQEAVGITLERNPNAFRPKIASSPQKPQDSNMKYASETQVIGKHNKGCHCKKSGCLKKYCECFQANIPCSENCKCMDCKNFEGSYARRVVFCEEDNLVHIRLAANAAISGAVGSASYGTHTTPKKRKVQEIFSGKQPVVQTVNLAAQHQQETHPIASSPLSLSASFASHNTNTRISGSSRSSYRSVLADVLQTQNVKNLCSLFIVLSKIAAKTKNEEMKGTVDRQIETGKNEASIASSAQSLQDSRDVIKPVCDDDLANKDEADAVDYDNHNRPLSPDTLALMCDEQDEMFFGNGSVKGVACNSTYPNMIRKSSNSDRCTNAYEEQERLILTKFCDVLRGLITLGSIKETMCSSLVKKEVGNMKEHVDNGNNGAKADMGREKGIHSSCVANCSTPAVIEISQTNITKSNGHDNSDLSLRLDNRG